MSISNQKSLLYKASCIALAATVFGAISFVTASDAEARERSRTGSYTTGKGKTYGHTAKGSYDKETGTYNKAVTGQNGKGYTASTTYDKETKTGTKTVTTNDGKTVTATGTAGDGQRSGTYTTGNGKTGSYNSAVTKEDGTYTKNRTVTTDDGKTYDSSATYAHDKDSNTMTGSRTNWRGKTRGGSVTYELNK